MNLASYIDINSFKKYKINRFDFCIAVRLITDYCINSFLFKRNLNNSPECDCVLKTKILIIFFGHVQI